MDTLSALENMRWAGLWMCWSLQAACTRIDRYYTPLCTINIGLLALCLLCKGKL